MLALLDLVNVVFEVTVGDEKVEAAVEVEVGEEDAGFEPDA